jgi:hypothetical protein
MDTKLWPKRRFRAATIGGDPVPDGLMFSVFRIPELYSGYPSTQVSWGKFGQILPESGGL